MASDVHRLAALLLAHDSDRMECHDHIGLCCPAGCHDVGPKAEHQAAVIEAEVIRPREREAWELGYHAGELDGTYRLAVTCGYRAPAPLATNPFADEADR